MKGADVMKKALRFMGTVTLAGIILTLSCVTAFAATESKAYKILKEQIAEEDPILENYYAAYDKDGNDWHGIFDGKGKMVALAATVYDRGDAETIADSFGDKLYYKVPMEHRKGADFYQVVVPMYEDTELEMLCARPKSLYKDGYKVIEDWDLTKDGQVLILRTNLTSSYMVRLTSGDETAYIRWGSDWYPEEDIKK